MPLMFVLGREVIEVSATIGEEDASSTLDMFIAELHRDLSTRLVALIEDLGIQYRDAIPGLTFGLRSE